MPEPLEVHKALADPTRHRLYRYLRLSGRPVGVREMAVRLSLHPNTLRPHLRRLEDAAGTQLDEELVVAFVHGIETVEGAPLPGMDAARLWTPYANVA